MVYTRTTPDNTAVASLVAGGSCRVRSHGEAPLKITAGSYLIRIAVGERTDSASALLTIYDSGDLDNAVGVRLLTGSAGITDDGQDITATALDAWSSDGNQEYAFEVALPEPTGEWVLSLRTDESSAAVPMDFSGFHVEDTLQRGTAQVGPGDIAVNALGRCRYAAFGGKGASGTNAFATVSWNISAGANISWAFTIASRVTPNAEVLMLGNSDADNRINVRIHTNGALRVYNRNTLIAESAAGVVAFDGLTHVVRGTITPTTATATVNGASVLNVTFAAQSWVTGSAYNWQICGIAPTAGQHWPGSIQLVELLDNVTPANSIRLLMDEPSGNYANTYPGSTAAASATRNGYVSTVPVLSLDGRGMPWQPAAMSCLHFGRAAAISAGLYLPPSGIGANVANGIVIPFPARIAAVTVRPIDGAAATLTVSIAVDGSSATTLALSAADSVTSYPNIAVTAGQRIAASCSAFTSGGSSGLTVAVWLLHNSVAG